MDFFNYILEGFDDLGNMFIDALPASPITWLATDETIRIYLGYVNWFIPIYAIIATLEAWLVAVLGWYVLQWILRWVKFTE